MISRQTVFVKDGKIAGRICGTCIHFKGMDRGECLRHAPGPSGRPLVSWPETCGDHEIDWEKYQHSATSCILDHRERNEVDDLRFAESRKACLDLLWAERTGE